MKSVARRPPPASISTCTCRPGQDCASIKLALQPNCAARRNSVETLSVLGVDGTMLALRVSLISVQVHRRIHTVATPSRRRYKTTLIGDITTITPPRLSNDYALSSAVVPAAISMRVSGRHRWASEREGSFILPQAAIQTGASSILQHVLAHGFIAALNSVRREVSPSSHLHQPPLYTHLVNAEFRVLVHAARHCTRSQVL
ncbi:hypothetical protein BKA62DRAFT_369618 [Auriculariales sp. MPI-PUGE-AT-0066]|nr:hypothetical protein BKA62DRAFT_369618 [Auriculariales sp. MPI-PUGE-AT-0066]